MERLTISKNKFRGTTDLTECNGKACGYICADIDGNCDNCPIEKAFARLSSYEDTGLTPEEILVMGLKGAPSDENDKVQIDSQA